MGETSYDPMFGTGVVRCLPTFVMMSPARPMGMGFAKSDLNPKIAIVYKLRDALFSIRGHSHAFCFGKYRI